MALPTRPDQSAGDSKHSVEEKNAVTVLRHSKKTWKCYQTSKGIALQELYVYSRARRNKLSVLDAKEFQARYQYFIEIDEKTTACVAAAHIDICDKVIYANNSQLKPTEFQLYKNKYLLSIPFQDKQLVFLNIESGEVHRVEIDNINFNIAFNEQICLFPNNENQCLFVATKNLTEVQEILLVEFNLETAKVIKYLTPPESNLDISPDWKISQSGKFFSASFSDINSHVPHEGSGFCICTNENFQLKKLVTIPGAKMMFWSDDEFVYLDENNRVCSFDCVHATNHVLQTLNVKTSSENSPLLFPAIKTKEIFYEDENNQVCVYDYMQQQLEATKQLQDVLTITGAALPIKNIMIGYFGNTNYLLYANNPSNRLPFSRELQVKSMLRTEIVKSNGYKPAFATLRKQILDKLLNNLLTAKLPMSAAWQEIQNNLSPTDRDMILQDTMFVRFVQTCVTEPQSSTQGNNQPQTTVSNKI